MAMATTLSYCVLVLCLALTVRGQLDEEQLNNDQVDAQQSNVDNMEGDAIKAGELYAEMTEADQLDSDNADLKSVSDFFCRYKCGKGKKAVKNEAYTPSATGCSSKGGSAASMRDCPYLTGCCNAHDICYGTFGQSKSTCDATFKSCTKRTPVDMSTSIQSKCKRTGSEMWYRVNRRGCAAYRRGQSAATICQRNTTA